MKLTKFTAAALAVLLFPAYSFAGHPLITDDAYTQGKNHWQFEWAAEYDRFSDGDFKEEAVAVPVLPSVTYGLFDSLDLVATSSYVYTKATDGEDTERTKSNVLEIQAKWRFFETESLFLALKPGILIPLVTEMEGTVADNMAYSMYFIGTYNIGAFDFHLNSGYIAYGEEGYFTNAWHNSLAGEWNFAGDFKLVANTGFDYEENMNRNFPVFALGGLVYSPSENLDFDLGYKRMFRIDTGVNYAVVAGVTLRI